VPAIKRANRTIFIETCSVVMGKASTIVAIGTSAGGVSALRQLVLHFGHDWPMSVFVTIHTGRSPNHLPDLLAWASPLPVRFARDGDTIAKGIYIAPPDRHLIIGVGKTFLSAGPRENYARPAIDPMFRSAAEHHGGDVIGILLTGYLHDGASGLYEIHRAGGRTIVQDPRDAEVPEIPLHALDRLVPDHVLPLSKIPSAISQELQRRGAGLQSEGTK
jgi:two-component system, chemotaxis family, protein-glutamate methylesterase/glutaminase